MEKKEEFKTINGYEGFYQVSNLGNVKSLSRWVFNGKGDLMFLTERILKPSKVGFKGNDYETVILHKEGTKNSIKIHKLVYATFIGDLAPKMTIDHIDNNRFNNNVENLQQITQRENTSKDKKNKTSQYTGVSWHKINSKWLAHININGTVKHLGCFTSEGDASSAYQNALKNLTE